MVMWFLKWLISWGGLIDSLIGIFTLGFYKTELQLIAAIWYAKFNGGINNSEDYIRGTKIHRLR